MDVNLKKIGLELEPKLVVLREDIKKARFMMDENFELLESEQNSAYIIGLVKIKNDIVNDYLVRIEEVAQEIERFNNRLLSEK